MKLSVWCLSGNMRRWCWAGMQERRCAKVEQRNHLKLGDELEVLRPGGSIFRQRLDEMTDLEGTALACAPHPRQELLIRLDQPAGKLCADQAATAYIARRKS